MQYERLPTFSETQAKALIAEGSAEELILLPLSVGMYYDNWKLAQEICVILSKHKDDRVSSNAVLGLAYIAMNHRILEKSIVLPVVMSALENHTNHLPRVRDAAEDINNFLGWSINLPKV